MAVLSDIEYDRRLIRRCIAGHRLARGLSKVLPCDWSRHWEAEWGYRRALAEFLGRKLLSVRPAKTPQPRIVKSHE